MINILVYLSIFCMSITFFQCNDDEKWEWLGEKAPELNSNAEFPLEINNYLGNTENIHPKVLYFPNGWRDYEFWMAYTPYPKGDINKENPCIAVSHDGLNWETPSGTEMPLNSSPRNGYNSDTHLVYDKQKDVLECWWREFDIQTGLDAICRRITSNGIDWSQREIVLPFEKTKGLRLSPAVEKEDNVYVMIYSNSKDLYLIAGEKIDNAWKWSEPRTIPINWRDLHPWHQDFITDREGNREMIVCAYGPQDNNNSADLYYVKTDHNFTASEDPVLILKRARYAKAFDYQSIYRSSLVNIGSYYYLYYSSIDKLGHRHLGMSIGKSPTSLVGYGKSPYIELPWN